MAPCTVHLERQLGKPFCSFFVIHLAIVSINLSEVYLLRPRRSVRVVCCKLGDALAEMLAEPPTNALVKGRLLPAECAYYCMLVDCSMLAFFCIQISHREGQCAVLHHPFQVGWFCHYRDQLPICRTCRCTCDSKSSWTNYPKFVARDVSGIMSHSALQMG